MIDHIDMFFAGLLSFILGAGVAIITAVALWPEPPKSHADDFCVGGCVTLAQCNRDVAEAKNFDYDKVCAYRVGLARVEALDQCMKNECPPPKCPMQVCPVPEIKCHNINPWHVECE